MVHSVQFVIADYLVSVVKVSQPYLENHEAYFLNFHVYMHFMIE
jgi:hypothetical protein